MPYRAWDDLWGDPDYRREVRAWREDLDAAVREETELADRERDRFGVEDVRMPLLPTRPA